MITKIAYKIRRIFRCFYGIGYKEFKKNSVIHCPLIISKKKYITIKENVTIRKNSRIECYDNYCTPLFPELIIEKNVIIGYNFQCLVTDKCFIGEDTLIASNVLITTENHGMNPKILYRKQPLISAPVHIGKNCWIGERVIILPGVQIGDNCIIGAGSIVTKSIESNSLAVGTPAKIIKKYNLEKDCWEQVK